MNTTRARKSGVGALLLAGLTLVWSPAPAADGASAGAKARDALFDDDSPAQEQPTPAQTPTPAPAKDALTTASKPAPEPAHGLSPWKGFVQTEFAYTNPSPEHWSKARALLDLSRQGQWGEGLKWKIGGRLTYDLVYDRSNHYPDEVRQDQRRGFMLTENYLDTSSGDWEFRFGRQHVVWGEMVGLFFADVVSARDMREFLLPEFDVLRIPQWAARAEYFKGDYHAELLWVPTPSYDLIGKPGADFYPYPLPVQARYLGEIQPARTLSNTNYGVRLSVLKSGWDVSGFVYHSQDVAPTFYRVSPLLDTNQVFQPRHDAINQLGGTLAKDLDGVLLRAEAVYTSGRKYNVTRLDQPDGLVTQNTLDYVASLEFALPADGRLNLQFFQRLFFDHDPDIIPASRESGASVFVSGKLMPKLEAQALLISSVNRRDWMFRPRISWEFQPNWRFATGVDVFGGAATGLFGRYSPQDRVYGELRYTF